MYSEIILFVICNRLRFLRVQARRKRDGLQGIIAKYLVMDIIIPDSLSWPKGRPYSGNEIFHFLYEGASSLDRQKKGSGLSAVAAGLSHPL